MSTELKSAASPLCECDNCGYRAAYDTLPTARDIEERCADPRDAFSDVECPKCGALCFPVVAANPLLVAAQVQVATLEKIFAYLHSYAKGEHMSDWRRVEPQAVLAQVYGDLAAEFQGFKAAVISAAKGA